VKHIKGLRWARRARNLKRGRPRGRRGEVLRERGTRACPLPLSLGQGRRQGGRQAATPAHRVRPLPRQAVARAGRAGGRGGVAAGVAQGWQRQWQRAGRAGRTAASDESRARGGGRGRGRGHPAHAHAHRGGCAARGARRAAQAAHGGHAPGRQGEQEEGQELHLGGGERERNPQRQLPVGVAPSGESAGGKAARLGIEGRGGRKALRTGPCACVGGAGGRPQRQRTHGRRFGKK